ncbi:MAG: trigger factor [Erysipelotrichaceae bacterium]|jgi:trigger factor|nr:trigger factor [Erysipelotrichaceae bacterium]
MSRTVNKLPNAHVEVICPVDEKTWKDAQEAAFKKLAAKVEIPGFRKGKAPENLVRGKVNPGQVFDEAINAVLPKLYKAILEEEKIEPYAQPKVDVTKLSETELEVKFTITVSPEVKLGKYKGLEIGKTEVSVTDEELEADMKRLLDNSGTLVVKEGKSEKGDTVVFDFKGTVNGEEFEGGSAENYELVLGSNAFIPGFEDQLVGYEAGAHVDVKVKFPEQYTEELKGKDAVFACDIHEVKSRKPATLDEEFVKDQGIKGVETIDQLKEHQKNALLESKKANARSEYFNKLIDAIVKDSKLEIPEEIIDSQFQSRKEEFEGRMAQSGITKEQYLQIIGQSEEDLNKQLRANATREVTNYLVLEEIGRAEKLNTLTDEDLEFEFSKLAEQYGMKLEDVKKALTPNLGQFKNQVVMGRIENFLIENNK